MKLTIVGCSGSYAGPHSPASCYLVQADLDGRTWSILLDLGNGALGELQRHLAPRDVDAVVLSHLHPDHCADLSGLHVMLRYDPAGAPEAALPIYGPRGTDLRAARASGVSDDEAGDAQLLRPEMDFRDLADAEVFTIGPFRITPLRVNHPVEAYGLRVEADGRTLAYTGDTDTCAALTPLMTKADLVLSDSAFCEDRDDVEGIHLSGHRAATAAVLAGGVKRLMLTHIPPWNDPEVCRAEADLVWPGDVELAQPGATYVL
ncbi:MBL fold metallo-hydrolase [Rudaeicoccus suwonensis]|uniref:Ribonuclease BN (tRNA processing enzyme) n=1 Tax=Rudaeicoccus suwonensis TaxID=657409 RepID=A0A561DWV2_9MICO|nr:MBL fold metallo-hydrolase [Rudaeicoccus suwonensis]TWE07855.1 ribonuclease BN (tRNA processing enzyme) [Rudaeicoccus suwonensis]